MSLRTMTSSRVSPSTPSTRSEFAVRPYALFVHALRHLNGHGLKKDTAEAARLLRLSADKGCVEALSILGLCFLKGHGVKKDAEEAVRCFRQGATVSCLKSEVELAKCIRDGTGTEKNKDKAFKMLRRLSKSGSTEAMVELGRAYRKEHEAYISYQKAEATLYLAHFLGNTDATYGLASDFSFGKRSLQYCLQADRDGSKDAVFLLAKIYFDSYDVKKSIRKVLHFLRRGVKLDNFPCCVFLGWLFQVGLGVEQDYSEALRLYTVAHDNGDREGTTRLGVISRDGLGVPKDHAKANSLFRQAMEAGSSFGEACLGYSYLFGLGVAESDETAVKHFRNADDSSHGRIYLALCYQAGVGVEQDVQKAFELINGFGYHGFLCEDYMSDRIRHVADCYWNGRGTEEDQDKAVDLYWRAADTGSKWALSILTSLHCQKDIQVQKVKRKILLLNHCMTKGCVGCKVDLAKLLLNRKRTGQDTAKGCRLLEEVVLEGCPTGMVQLAVHYLCHEDKREKAFDLFNQASKSDGEAGIFVGFCLEHGFGVERNSQEAILWYQKGFGVPGDVERNSPAAAYVISYSDGDHLDRASENLFKKAIKAGDEHGLARFGLQLRRGGYGYLEPEIDEDRSASEKLKIRMTHLAMEYRESRGIETDDDESLRYLLLAEKKGSDIAGVEIGTMYASGHGVQKDPIAAIGHFRRALLKGCAAASIGLANISSENKDFAHDFQEALRVIKEASDSGNVDAHMSLAFLYDLGAEEVGIDCDLELAARYYRLAADMNNPTAQNTLGVYTKNGRGVERDVDEGLRLIRASAKNGDSFALLNLAEMYMHGTLVEMDFDRGVRYLRRSREKHNWKAAVLLGKLHKAGIGIPRDPEEAFMCFAAASLNGNAEGQVQSGVCLRDGVGTEKRSFYAAYKFERAADMGNKDAKILLGLCYRSGEGVERSDAFAMEMFRQAADMF